MVGEIGKSDLPLNAINPRPRGYQGKNASNDIDEDIWGVILVPSRSPELVKTRATNDQCGINFEPVAAERRVLEILLELFQIALYADIRKVWHHMSDNLETSVLREVKGFRDGANSMPAISVSCDVFVHRLDSYLKTRAPITKHLAEMWSETIVWPGLYRDTDSL